MLSLPIFTVDAFSRAPFGGNQAAVCLDTDWKVTEDTMQSLASEMNISETVYLQPEENCGKSFKNGSTFKIRWFTPTNEVPLCGHATLAAAAVIFFECGNINEEITFHSLSGDLRARKQNDGVTLDFPKNEPKQVEMHNWQPLLRAVLGEAMKDVQCVLIAPIAKKMLVVLNEKYTSDSLQCISPNIEKMMEAHDGSLVKGVILSAKSTGDYDFISRYFAPWVGIAEDPVTGSAHTVLGPYWSSVLGKKELNARQCSRRGGDVRVLVGIDRVFLTGSTVTMVRGTVNLPL